MPVTTPQDFQPIYATQGDARWVFKCEEIFEGWVYLEAEKEMAFCLELCRGADRTWNVTAVDSVELSSRLKIPWNYPPAMLINVATLSALRNLRLILA